MSFIAAYHERGRDRVLVWERTPANKRVVVEYSSPYYFYVPDPNGPFESITGEKLKKVSFDDKSEMENACYSFPKRFESDLSPLEKVLTDNYADKEPPKLIVGFIDIETDYDPNVIFKGPEDPYAPINSITIYRNDLDTYFTLAVPPRGWDQKLPEEMIEQNYILCNSERELLEYFLDLIEDVDVLSGWNSEFFDIPYIGKRIELLFGKDALRRLGFERAPTPRWSEHERFKGSTEKDIVLDLLSRVHLDYMKLFRKFNLEGRQSYALAAISADELQDSNGNQLYPKLDFGISLHELYNTQFINFITYNRRDVEIIVKLDEKFKYIDLANAMVHEATVNFPAIFGSVQLIDTAIINYSHKILKKIVFDKQHSQGEGIEGGLVLSIRPGFHKWIASCDINSLYPSTYRSLNLSPEKIVGQLVEKEQGWRAVNEAMLYPDNGFIQDKKLNIMLEGSKTDESVEITAGEIVKMLKEQKFAISAFGTILDQSSGEGLLPAVLTYWFKGRKEMQAKKKEFTKKADSILASAPPVPDWLD